MIEDKINEIVKDTVDTLGFVLVECLYYGKRNKKKLRVVLYHKDRDVSTKDCAKVSNVISQRLDVEDIIEESYALVVESPGVDRTLNSPNEYKIFKGKELRIILHDASKYELQDNVVIGKNIGFDGAILIIEHNGKIYNLDLNDIAKSNLYFDIKKYLSHGGK